MSVAQSTAAGVFALGGDGVGCLGATCDNPGFRLKVTATVTDPVPAESGTEDFSVASPDRVKAGVPAAAGLTALRDEGLVLAHRRTPEALSDAQLIAVSIGAEVTGGLEVIGVYEMRWIDPVADMPATLARLRATDGVASADQSLLGGADNFDVTPSDWSDDGPAVRWPFQQAGVTKAWDTVRAPTFPSASSIAGPCWSGHEDLNVVKAFGNDPEDHATHIAGLACARQNNKGIVGAAWGCPITTAGLSESSPKAILASATKVALAKPRVINMSLGKNQRSQTWCLSQTDSNALAEGLRDGYSTQFEFLFNGPTGRDIVWTLAAGNNCGQGTHSWMGIDNWSLPNVVTVASFNSDKELSTF